MNEIMPMMSNEQLIKIVQDGYGSGDYDLDLGIDKNIAKAQRKADRKWIWELLLNHKVYQRKYNGQLQIMFGFSPDELEALKEA